MKLAAITAALLLTTAAVAQPASGPTEYKLTVSPETLNAIGRGLDELPAKIANPISQDLVRQVKEQQDAYAKAHAPAPTPEPDKPKE